ncbi:MAG: DUF4260 domain-containing protein [bacterium]
MSSTDLAPGSATSSSLRSPAVRGGVRVWLHVEAAVALAVTLVLYRHTGASWATFGALFLVPDLALLGYVFGPRAGAAAYNTVHSHAGPLALAAIGVLGPAAVLPYALIWLAHCSLDRAVGYGLKYATAAGDTHLRHGSGRRPVVAA